jgi:hypothetical protein
MSDYKNNTLAPAAGHDVVSPTVNGNGNGGAKVGYESALKNGNARRLAAPAAQEMGGWDSYRRWLSRVQAPDKRRTTMDPALYTWKGYRNWSDKVRRDWKQDE